jgi:putative transposase
LAGIEVIETEESYTSKCSAIDLEPKKKHEQYLGKRIKRGLFKTSQGKLINADLNGSLKVRFVQSKPSNRRMTGIC